MVCHWEVSMPFLTIADFDHDVWGRLSASMSSFDDASLFNFNEIIQTRRFFYLRNMNEVIIYLQDPIPKI